MRYFKRILKGLIDSVCLPIVLLLFFLLLPMVWVLSRKRRRRLGKPRIIWGPISILTIATNSKASRLYGYESHTLVYSPNYLTEAYDFNLECFTKKRLLAPFIPWLVFLWSLLKYDIFQFYYDGGFLYRTLGRWLELPLLRMAGKKIIISAYGADVRVESITRSLGKYNCCLDCAEGLKGCICDEKKARINLEHKRKWANLLLSMGDMVEYTPGSNNHIFYWPIDLEEWKYVGPPPRGNSVKIVHASNHRHYKGTRFLLKGVEELKREGHPVEIVLVEKVPNKEARRIYESADIVAEQFLIGWHGYFAIEAMALGKPVVAYIRKEEYLPQGIKCPIVNANPDNLKSVLAELVKNRDLREKLGKEGRRYVEEVYSLEQVGKRWDTLYQKLYWLEKDRK